MARQFVDRRAANQSAVTARVRLPASICRKSAPRSIAKPMLGRVNYYEHHLGDYARDTRHLTILEHGAYRLLLDIYYASEEPLPLDMTAIERLAGARTHSEKKAIRTVIEEFFISASDGWRHERCDKVISAYRQKREKAQKSAKKRWSPSCERIATAERTHCDGNAKAMLPITNNQEPYSVTNVTDGKPSPRDELFALVAPTAKQFGIGDKQTRSLFGQAVKLAGGDHAAVVSVVNNALRDPPLEFAAWLIAACKPKSQTLYGMDLTDDDLNP